MKILLLGSSQTKHIEKVFLHSGHRAIVMQNKKSSILNRINFAVQLLRCSALYHVGGVDVRESFFLRLAKILGKKIIVHWIGSDVLVFTKKYQEHHRAINKNCINLVVSKHLQAELRAIEIESAIVPIFPPDFSCEAMESPNKHGVLSYIPEGREDFYNIELVKQVAARFPDVQFHIVANSGKKDCQSPANMVYHGFLNGCALKNLYRECSLLFRFPEHDGLPVMVLEALGYGREVIYCYEFPYVRTPKSRDFKDVVEVFEQIFSVLPKKNEEAALFISHEFSMEKQIEYYKNLGIIS